MIAGFICGFIADRNADLQNQHTQTDQIKRLKNLHIEKNRSTRHEV
jgi:hypothetical protein